MTRQSLPEACDAYDDLVAYRIPSSEPPNEVATPPPVMTINETDSIVGVPIELAAGAMDSEAEVTTRDGPTIRVAIEASTTSDSDTASGGVVTVAIDVGGATSDGPIINRYNRVRLLFHVRHLAREVTRQVHQDV